MKQNEIIVNGTKIEALDNGGITIDGVRVSSVGELEKVVNILMKATISIVQS